MTPGKCRTCERDSDTLTCTNCWEVERRFEDYIASPKGRNNALRLLGTIDINALKREIGKERARCDRMGKEIASDYGKDRAFGEANICSLVLGMIDRKLRKLKEGI